MKEDTDHPPSLKIFPGSIIFPEVETPVRRFAAFPSSVLLFANRLVGAIANDNKPVGIEIVCFHQIVGYRFCPLVG